MKTGDRIGITETQTNSVPKRAKLLVRRNGSLPFGCDPNGFGQEVLGEVGGTERKRLSPVVELSINWKTGDIVATSLPVADGVVYVGSRDSQAYTAGCLDGIAALALRDGRYRVFLPAGC